VLRDITSTRVISRWKSRVNSQWQSTPVILDDADHDLWLSGDWAEAQRLVAPYPSQLMAVTP